MDLSVHADFGQIPCEIMIQIFDNIGHRNRKKSRLVCHRWNQILDDCGKYFIFHAKWNNRSLNSIIETNLCMDRVILQNMTSRMPTNQFPEIKESVLGWRNSQGNILKFLFGCRNTDALAIVEFSLGEISETAVRKSLRTIVWNNLAQLNLTMILTKYMFERTRTHLENCMVLLQLINIPNVRKLDLYFEVKHSGPHFCEKPEARFQNVCLALYEFLSGHANTMKILKCSIGTNRRRKFLIPEIPEKLKQSVAEKLKLESCTMKLWGVGQIEVFVSPILLRSQMKNLDLETTKCVRKRERWSRHMWTVDTHLPTFENNLSQIFITNGNTLQNVRLCYLPAINFSWLKTCARLETVALISSINIMSMVLPSTVPNPILNSSFKTLISVEISDFSYNVDLAWFENCLRLKNLHINSPILLQWNDDDFPQQNLHQSAHCMNLKKLHLTSDSDFVYNPVGKLLAQQLLDRNRQSLQCLTLGFTPYVSLSNLFALRCLSLKDFLLEYTFNCTPLNFKYLTELHVDIWCDAPRDRNTIDWILQNMRSLQTISTVYDANVSIMKRLLSLPKSKKIEFEYFQDIDEVYEFWQKTPGLQLEKVQTSYNVTYTLLVDRTVYLN